LRELAHAESADLPLVLIPDGDTLHYPSTLDLASALGLHTSAQQPLYDVCIVGGVPARLAAAVYGASEGLSTVIVERDTPGGQAGHSASIENSLGFPTGLSGSDLAQRALAQASRFGAEMVLAGDVVGFEARGRPVRAVLIDGSGEIEARALIVATGVSY
jgi:thioredoxin reductase (NADPH)